MTQPAHDSARMISIRLSALAEILRLFEEDLDAAKGIVEQLGDRLAELKLLAEASPE